MYVWECIQTIETGVLPSRYFECTPTRLKTKSKKTFFKQNQKSDIKVKNVTNPKSLRGSSREYLEFEATFRSDKPKNHDNSHVHVLGLKFCSEQF